MQSAMRVILGGLVWITLISYFGLADPIPEITHEESMSADKSQDEIMQTPLESQMTKRAWRQLPQGGWGKRAWHSMPSTGWGKRVSDSFPLYSNNDKRTWQKFQGAWGKRSWTPNEEWALAKNFDNEPQYDDYYNIPSDSDSMFEEEKRKWQSLNPSWGKRATDWESFRGSWGKRDPAWNNLKGLWGKRSMPNNISA